MAEGDQEGKLLGSADLLNIINGDHENRAKLPVTSSLPMNGGNGTYSYSKNSYYQVYIRVSVYVIVENRVSHELHQELLFMTLLKLDPKCSELYSFAYIII